MRLCRATSGFGLIAANSQSFKAQLMSLFGGPGPKLYAIAIDNSPYRDHGRVGGWCIESIRESPQVYVGAGRLREGDVRLVDPVTQPPCTEADQ